MSAGWSGGFPGGGPGSDGSGQFSTGGHPTGSLPPAPLPVRPAAPAPAKAKRDGSAKIGWGWGLVAFALLGLVASIDSPDTTLGDALTGAGAFLAGGIALLVIGYRERNRCVTCRRRDPEAVLLAQPTDYLCGHHIAERDRILRLEAYVLDGVEPAPQPQPPIQQQYWATDAQQPGSGWFWDGARWVRPPGSGSIR